MSSLFVQRRGVSSLVIGVVAVVVVAGAAGAYVLLQGYASANPRPLRVFAASSMTFALDAMNPGFEKNYSASLSINYAGSNTLATQITQGTPADVFISANLAQMKVVQNKSLLADGNTYQILLYNYLAVFIPVDNPKHLSSLADLAKPGVRVVVEDKSVPAGAYTLQIWDKIQSTWGNQSSGSFKSSDYANYSSKVAANVVSYALDVETGIQQVLTGAADAGFAYVSDAEPRGAQLSLIQIPQDVNVKATYVIAVISSSAVSDLAHDYVNWLLSPAGQALLSRWGFTPAH